MRSTKTSVPTASTKPAKPAGSTDRRSVLAALGLSAATVASWPTARHVLHPTSAQAKPMSEIEVTEVAAGVFVHTGHHALYAPDNHGDISNAAFVIGGDAVAVIDTGGSYWVGTGLKAAITERTDRPVRFVINTHMHPDHIFGNAAFSGENTAFVAHHKLARGLAARAERYLAINRELLGEEGFTGTKIVMPTQGLTETTTLDLGDRTLKLIPRATAHTDNDLTILDDKTKTLFAGDLVFSGHVPTLDGSIVGWRQVLTDLAMENPSKIVPGHGPASLETAQAIDPMTRYIDEIISGVRRTINGGETLSSAIKTVGWNLKNDWQLFSEYHGRNVSAAFAELEWE